MVPRLCPNPDPTEQVPWKQSLIRPCAVTPWEGSQERVWDAVVGLGTPSKEVVSARRWSQLRPASACSQWWGRCGGDGGDWRASGSRKYTESVPFLPVHSLLMKLPLHGGHLSPGSPGPPLPRAILWSGAACELTWSPLWSLLGDGRPTIMPALPPAPTLQSRRGSGGQPFSPHPSQPGCQPEGAQRGTSNSGFISLGQAQGLFL